MAFHIIYDETLGFRFETEEHRIDPLSMKFSYYGPNLPLEEKVREAYKHYSYKDGEHILWHGVNLKVYDKKRDVTYFQQRCKIGKVHYRPTRIALCDRFDIAYDTLPRRLNLVRNQSVCFSATCIEPNHMMPMNYRSSVLFPELDPLSNIREDQDIFSENEPKHYGGYTKDASVEIATKGIQDFMDKINKMNGEK